MKKLINIITVFVLLFSIVSSPIGALTATAETTSGVSAEPNADAVTVEATEDTNAEALITEDIQLTIGGQSFGFYPTETNRFELNMGNFLDPAFTIESPLGDDNSVVTDLTLTTTSNLVSGEYSYNGYNGTFTITDGVGTIPVSDLIGQTGPLTLGTFKNTLAESGVQQMTFILKDEAGTESYVEVAIKGLELFETVEFIDTNLEAKIKEQLGIEDRAITPADMKQLNELYINNSGIEDLSGLQYAINLKHLHAQNNKISNLGPIDNLTNLETLVLSYNNIEDISLLGNLTNLTSLSLVGNDQLKDVSILSNLTSLIILALEYTSIEDITPLSSLENLVRLYIKEIDSLDLSEGSNNLETIQYLEANGVDVEYSLSTDEEVPPTDPDVEDAYLYFTHANKTHDTITIHWDVDGPFESFDLWLDGVKVDTVSADTRYYEFKNLQPNTNYSIEISSQLMETHGYSSMWTETTDFDRSNFKEVAFNIVNENDEPIGWEYNYQFKGLDEANQDFALSGNIIEGTFKTWDEATQSDGNPHLPVGAYQLVVFDWNDKTRSQTYKIEIEEATDYVQQPIQLTLNERELTSQPFELTVTNVTDTTITIQWPEMQNITGYGVDIYTNNGYLPYTELEPEATSHSLTDLEPNTTYYVNVNVQLANGLTLWKQKTVKTSGEVTGEVVHFADTALEGVIREELGIYFQDITTTDLEELQYLSVSDKGISDLSGLEYAINLETLYLADNQIVNLEPLSKLSKLTDVSLWGNQIEDVTPLSNLTNLLNLDLDDNEISDPNPLLGLSSLQNLYIYNNPITNVDAIIALLDAGVYVGHNVFIPDSDTVYVDVVNVDEKSISIEWNIDVENGELDHYELVLDGDTLSEQTVVENVDAGTNAYTFSDLQPNGWYSIEVHAVYKDGTAQVGYADARTILTNDVELKMINLPESYDEQFEFYLQGISNSSYHIYENGVIEENGYLARWAGDKTFSLPAGQYEVEVRDLNGDMEEGQYYIIRVEQNTDYVSQPIELDFARKAEPVEIVDGNLEQAIRDSLGIFDRELNSIDLERLQYLYGDRYGIRDLSGLEKAVNLTEINLRANEIEDITPLAELTDLTWLVLWENNVEDISALENLANLEYLDLDDNKIKDVSPVSGLTNLQRLYLSTNPITDISSLKTLTNLEYLALNGVPLDFENTDSQATIDILKDAGVEVSYDNGVVEPYLYVYNNEVTDSSINIEWWMDNNSDVEGYELHLNGEIVDTVSADVYSYTFDELQPNTEYEIVVFALGADEPITANGVYVYTNPAKEDMKNVKLRILDAEDAAISKGLEYSIQGTGENNSHIFQYGYTDSEGFFRSWYTPGTTQSLPVGQYEVTVYGEGIYQATFQDIEIEADKDYENNPIEITVDQLQEETKTVTVKVTDQAGNPVKSIEYLSLYSYQVMNAFNYKLGDYSLWNVQNENGEYTIENVLVTDTYEYQLNVRSNDFITYNATNVSVTPDTELIEVTLNPGATLTGTVVDADGNPLAANYYVYGNQTYEYGSTNGEAINIGGLTPENLTVELSLPGYQTKVIEVVTDQFVDNKADLGDITLQSEKYVHGTILKEDGTPASNVWVYLYEEGSRWISYSARTDANGYFKIHNVADKTYTLKTDSYNLPDITEEDVVPSPDERSIILEEAGEGSFVGEGNNFTAAKQTVVPGKALDYRLNYKNNGDAAAENVRVSFELAEDVELIEESILLNGKEVELVGDDLVIPLVEAGAAGTITFKTNVAENAKETLISTATITLGENEKAYTATSKVLFVTLNAPEVTASSKVKVYGNAKPGSIVGIYDGNVLLAETVAETKWWFADVTLPVQGEESTHKLVAKVTEGEGSSYSQPVTVKYEPNIPEVTDVKISAGWNQNISVNPNVGVVTTAIVEYTPIDIKVQFDQDVEDAKIRFLGEEYSLVKDGDTYKGNIPGTWSSYGEQMMELIFTKGEQTITLPLMEVIVLIDPSGYVFEGSMENRLQGVTAVVEERLPEGWKQWNAAFFGQVNPQVTDEDGRYGWDVIQGDWRVIFSKDGYETYTSRTVVVPPAETQLNVPLVRTSAPVVDTVTPAANADEVSLDSKVTITFDRLMNESNINSAIQVLKDGQPVAGTFTLEGMNGYKETEGRPGYFEEDTTKKLSQTIVWTPTEQLEAETTYTVVINNEVADYAGKTLAEDVTYSFTTVPAPEEPGDGDGSDTEEPGTGNEDGGDTEEPGTDDGDGGDTEEPGTGNEDGGDTEEPGTGNEDGGNTEEPGTANEDGGNTEEPGTGNEDGGNTEQPGAGNEDDNNTEKPGTDNGDTGKDTPGDKEGSEGEQPTKPETKPVTEKPVVKDQKATLNDSVFESLENEGTIVVDVNDTKDLPQLEVELSANQVALLKEKNANLAVQKGEVSLNIPASVFTNGNEKVSIIIKKLKDISYGLSGVYDFTIKQGNKTISEFANGITLTFAVDASKVNNPENVKVFYLNEKTNKWELVGGTYANGVVTATTDHFSTFTVLETSQDVVSQPSASDEQVDNELPVTAGTMYNWLLVGLILLLAGAALFVGFRRRHV